jgi:hypothetical protein
MPFALSMAPEKLSQNPTLQDPETLPIAQCSQSMLSLFQISSSFLFFLSFQEILRLLSPEEIKFLQEFTALCHDHVKKLFRTGFSEQFRTADEKNFMSDPMELMHPFFDMNKFVFAKVLHDPVEVTQRLVCHPKPQNFPQ